MRIKKITLKRILKLSFFVALMAHVNNFGQSWIRINQLGYLQKSVKAAVLCSKADISPKEFELCDALTDKTVYATKKIISYETFYNKY